MWHEICFMSATELIERYRNRVLSPVEVTETMLEQIEKADPLVNAFVTVTGDHAIAQAKKAEALYKRGDAHALAGVPISIKDLTPTKGIRTTRGSKLSEDWIPDYDAPFVHRVLDAGAILLGKTNTPEFGWKGETTNLICGSTRNPWGTDMTPGGSTGGGAAAVAACMGPLAQGSDGAGSIRIPASFCGVFGFKPTFGLVPQYPASIVNDLAHFGPITRTVEDAALLMRVTAESDVLDRFSWDAGFPFLNPSDESFLTEGLRVAWSPDLGYGPVEPEIVEIVEKAVETLRHAGVRVDEAHPALDDPWDMIDVIWSTANAGLHLDDLEEVESKIDPGRLEVVRHGQEFTATQLANAQIRRNAYYDGMRRFFEKYDLLLTPTLPCDPFPVGLDHPESINGKKTSYLGWTIFTYPFNLTGMPAATVPVGFSRAGYPVGLQIVGRRLEDPLVLSISALMESLLPWRQHHPPIAET